MTTFDYKAIWKEVLEIIRLSVSPANFSTWFTQTHLDRLTEENGKYLAQIGCNSSYVKDTIEGRYFGLVQDSLSKSLGYPCSLVFIVKDNPEKYINTETAVPLFENNDLAKENLEQMLSVSKIRPSFTFSNFAVSSSNQMAWAAAEAVSKNLGAAYNPLFLWGGVGVGKTHLMSAVGHSVLAKNPSLKVLFCTGEIFTNDIVEGIRNKTTQSFRDKYRKLDLLLVDDIQFIAGKDAVQEEFFHTFNAVTLAGGQIIMTSDKPPSEISRLEERLRSRFEAGLIVDIAPPDFELRCAITQIKTTEKGFALSMDLVSLIAGNIESARKIEGFLIRLHSEVTSKKLEITEGLIESLFGKGGENETNGQRPRVNPDEVIDVVCRYYSIGKRAILGAGKSRAVAFPRQVAMYILRSQFKLPLMRIGDIFGGRDHTTVMHAVEKVTRLASLDVQTREDLMGIKNQL